MINIFQDAQNLRLFFQTKRKPKIIRKSPRSKRITTKSLQNLSRNSKNFPKKDEYKLQVLKKECNLLLLQDICSLVCLHICLLLCENNNLNKKMKESSEKLFISSTVSLFFQTLMKLSVFLETSVTNINTELEIFYCIDLKPDVKYPVFNNYVIKHIYNNMKNIHLKF